MSNIALLNQDLPDFLQTAGVSSLTKQLAGRTGTKRIVPKNCIFRKVVGGEEMVTKIQTENWTAYDAVISTPDMMRSVGKLGKVLGPRGLMPNPKTGTVTTDVANAVREVKAGKVEFRVDKTGVIHVPFGKVSFDPQKLVENANTLLGAVVKAKPSAAKGKYVKSVTVCSTMGPGVQLDVSVYNLKAVV